MTTPERHDCPLDTPDQWGTRRVRVRLRRARPAAAQERLLAHRETGGWLRVLGAGARGGRRNRAKSRLTYPENLDKLSLMRSMIAPRLGKQGQERWDADQRHDQYRAP